jgi:hypothetical protein
MSTSSSPCDWCDGAGCAWCSDTPPAPVDYASLELRTLVAIGLGPEWSTGEREYWERVEIQIRWLSATLAIARKERFRAT